MSTPNPTTTKYECRGKGEGIMKLRTILREKGVRYVYSEHTYLGTLFRERKGWSFYPTARRDSPRRVRMLPMGAITRATVHEALEAIKAAVEK
jgi:hypothetical protein